MYKLDRDGIMRKETSKHKHIQEYLQSNILSGKWQPGERLPSENTLSDSFNMSRQTVRLALSQLHSSGLIEKMQGKGTFVSIKKSRMAAVLMTYIDEYIFPEIIRGIDRELTKNGYGIVLFYSNNTHEKERECLEYILKNDFDTLIIEPARSAMQSPNLDLFEKNQAQGRSIIFIHGYPENFRCSYVIENDELAGYMAVKHLVKNGHTRILGIFKQDDMQGVKRSEGFKKALLEASIPESGSMLVYYETGDRGDLFRKCSIPVDITAVVTYNDQVAIELIGYLKKKNIHIPGDISIVSFDDSMIAGDEASCLTSVAHPKQELGIAAAVSLLDLIGKKKDTIERIIDPQLVIRSSVKDLTLEDRNG